MPLQRGGKRTNPKGRADRLIVSLSPEDREAIDLLSSAWNVSRAEAVRRCVHAAITGADVEKEERP